MVRTKTVCFLLILTIVGSILRLYSLSNFPHGFHKDEAFLGYNAYSLLKTGKDMHGIFLPFHLKSFLYSPSGYSYFSIIPIFIFGLSEFSVRFTSAFLGTLTIIAVFLFVRILFANSSRKETIALCTAFFLTISPWHINLSRTATENTVVLFCIVLATYLYILWTNNKKGLLLIGVFLLFFISFFTYQAPRVFLPLFVPALVFFFKDKIDSKKLAWIALLYSIFILIPLVVILTSSNLSLRIKTVSIFATSGTQLVIDEHIREDGVSTVSPFISRLVHNKLIYYGKETLMNYFSHFTFSFLFSENGYPDRYRVPFYGLFHVIELPFMLYGVWVLAKKYTKQFFILLGWILLTPVGAALTFDDVPNLQRTLLMLPAFLVFSAIGVVHIIGIIPKKKYRKTCMVSVLLSLGLGMFIYLHQYYIHMPKYRPWYRQDGYRELVRKVNTILPNYKKAVITDRESSPTIYSLFYSKYDPALFQQQTIHPSVQDYDRVNFGSYEFSQEECPLKLDMDKEGKTILSGEKDVLYVNSSLCEIPQGVDELFTIQRQDSSKAFIGVALK